MASGQMTLVLRHLRALVRRQGAGGVADGELLERFVHQRDEAAFEVLVWRHGPMVLGLCQRLLHNTHDAEDVLQATFLTLVRKAGTITRRDSLGSWLYKVAYRIALRVRAQSARTARDGGALEDLPAAETADESAWPELRPLLDAAIQRLPEKYRVPIVLCHLQGKTNREAAEQLGCPIGTVSTRLTRGRELLRRQLARHGAALSATALGVLLERQAVAAVSTPLVLATVRAAVLFSAGQAGAAGAISAHVIPLVEGAGQIMVSTKFKVLALLVLATAGALAAGAGVAARREATPPPNAEPASSATPPRQPDQPRPAAQKANPARPASAPARAERPIVVRGRVLGPDGKPVPGARLYWPRIKGEPLSEDDIEFPQRGTTDAQGRFRLELPPSDVRPEWNIPLVATAPGYGVDGAQLPRSGSPAELTLHLVQDQPIRGRVVTTEGRAVAGARVVLAGVFASAQEQLDDFLTAWKREWQMAPQRMSRRLFLPPGPVLSTTTDKDGRFSITGAGAERVATLQVKGPGIAQAELYVITRPGFDPRPYNQAVLERIPPELRRPGQPPLLYGPTFDYVASPTRTIEGTVREAGSGKPVAGVRIFANAGYSNPVSAVSDRQGRYQLVGLPKMKEYLVHTHTDRNSPWLRQGARVQDTEGMAPLRVDFEMTRGVILTGRLMDRTTGKGMQGGVRFAPLPDNKFFGKKGYDSYRYERLMTGTDAEGRFRLAVLPGSGVLLAQVYGSEKQFGGLPLKPYKQATLSPAERKRLALTPDNTFAAAGNALEFLNIENACKVLDLTPDAGTVTCDLFLDRGRTLTVKVQDPAGKPLPGATVSGLTASWPNTFPLEEASCTVYALDPEQPRQLVFFHPGRKLAAAVMVRGDEKEPPAVRLQLTGTVTGRVLDSDGQPVAGAEVNLSFPSDTARELYRQLNQQREAVRTDRDGRFRLEGLVPDLKFGLSLHQGRTFLVGEPRIGLKQVGAGRTLDLGDIRTKPLAR